MNTETVNEILGQWDAVKSDRVARQDCLNHTGPGESPWSATQEFAWEMREHGLSRTLLAAMPELEQLLRPTQAGEKRK